jgi:hypothetical protein
MRLVGLLIAVGIVMYLVSTQMVEQQASYEVPCDRLRQAAKTGNFESVERLMVDTSKDRGMSRVALIGRAEECVQAGEMTADEAEMFFVSVLPE